ncbi:hypothetical protein [Salmonella phage PKM.Hi.22.6]|uniref:Uncharacterized protein n=1 Tax=phage PKM.Lu.22.1 TaxID=3049197 RepID=A0AAF0R9L3_9CAUD|nr:hypothetical protein [phage PKM.Lu.22.1]WKV17166.1 hypothetical protein [Salmonella phage PKM.Hi.22.6]
MSKATKAMNRPERMDAVANGALKVESFWLRGRALTVKRQGNWSYEDLYLTK